MRVLVEYGGIVFSGRGHRVDGDRSGFGINRGGLSGFDSSASSSEDVSRPGGDGSFMLPSTLSGIVRGIEGTAFASSESELIDLERQLKATRRQGAWQELTYTRGNVVRKALAQVTGEIQWEHDRWQGHRARFLISLRSADPWWIGETKSITLLAGDSGRIENRGTEPCWPRASVRGPVNRGWSVFGMTVDRPVATGEIVTVSGETGAVVSSSAGELVSVVTGAPTVLNVGISNVTFAAVGAGSCTVEAEDTYL